MTKDMLHTRNFFLRSMSIIYMSAFCSLYLQIPGLYGEKGILPAHTQLGGARSAQECFTNKKTLLCFSSLLGLNTSYMMQLLALAGTCLSFAGIVWQNCCTVFLFAALWVLYLSLYQVGQTFLWFQWDILLLEVGFLSIIAAPFTTKSLSEFRPRNLVSMWLVRWALFRLMFASGVVKLQSGCPTWWGLTALNVHYESQCIPTPLAWFAHQMPTWIHKLCVAGCLVIEIPVPFFFFSPVRDHRIFAFYSQVFLQLCIILTGNYNFFNLLTIAMCISLLDDTFLGHQRVRDFSSGLVYYAKKGANWAAKWIGFTVLVYYSLAYFSVKIRPAGGLDTNISFRSDEFAFWVSKAVPLAIAVGAFSLLITVAEALTTCLFEVPHVMRKTAAFFSTFAYAMVALSLFGISLVPFTTLHPPTKQKVWPVFRQWHAQSSDFHLTSSYGLFRHMTGVGGRPEVVFEGANKKEGPWIEYEFPFKPGRLDRSPPFVFPHQPRLDWQMWFAALSSSEQNPWLISTAYKLLLGEKDVTNLLDRSSPWRQKSPKFLRAQKYLYYYTSFNDTSGNWWHRKHETEYLRAITINDQQVLEHLKRQQFIGVSDIKVKNAFFARILDMIRDVFNVLENHFTVMGLLVAAYVVSYTRTRFFKHKGRL